MQLGLSAVSYRLLLINTIPFKNKKKALGLFHISKLMRHVLVDWIYSTSSRSSISSRKKKNIRIFGSCLNDFLFSSLTWI